MTTDRLYRQYVDERYRVLRDALRVAKRRPDWGLRLDQEASIRAEIRALVRIRWFVRRQMRAERARRAAVLGLPYHDWQALPEVIAELGDHAITEAELWGGYGITNREGDPAFNGAYDRW